MRLLLTGFEAFAGSPVNPSEQVVLALESDPPPGIELTTLILPVDARAAPLMLADSLAAVNPQVVICLGEASGRPLLSLERAALNILDFRIPDNNGSQVKDLPVLPGGPDAYFSTLPLRPLLERISENGIPAEISLSAGAYLCNQVFYLLMHWAAQQSQPIPAGFIHIPSLPEQVVLRASPAPSMALETSLRAVRLVIDYIVMRTQAEAGESHHV